MFGWGNYLFWPQLRNSNGTLYGWSLQDRNLIFASVGLGPGTIWGKAVGANQITSIQTVNMNGQDDPQLSVLLAGHNATGFGKITWLRYSS